VPISDKLRKLLAQFSVMRHEDKRDMLLPKGKSFYNQVPPIDMLSLSIDRTLT
jgi:hypothetical protein